MADLPASPTVMLPVQQVLEAMHPVCSHDLPNQVVALQSLLQLFAWDEAEKLSPQGREYFDRLQSIAGKTATYVVFLKELTRLHRHTPQVESLALPQVVAEARAEVQRLYPEHQWTWQCRWDAESASGDHRLVLRGLLQLLKLPVLRDATATTTVEMHTTALPDRVLWTITAKSSTAAAPACNEASLIEQRLTLALAQASLAATGIACRPVEGPAAGAISFALEIPKRSPHD